MGPKSDELRDPLEKLLSEVRSLDQAGYEAVQTPGDFVMESLLKAAIRATKKP